MYCANYLTRKLQNEIPIVDECEHTNENIQHIGESRFANINFILEGRKRYITKFS